MTSKPGRKSFHYRNPSWTSTMPPVRRATRKIREAIKKIPTKTASDKPKPKSKPLPSVERTNALSREEFMSLYISPSELSFQKKRKELGGNICSAQSEENVSQSQDSAPSQIPESERHNSYEISVHTASTIPATDLDSCFKLIELTSSAAYKDSSMGWSASEKRKEMKLPDMKYMILRRRATANIPNGYENVEGDDQSSDTGEFAGFIEFMVTYEDGYEVLYCYEIHLMPEVQSQGLGEELMERFERIGRAIGLEKAMLTVFKSNSRALKFYMRVGYTEDKSSPRPRKLRNGNVKEADYMIMSKSLR